MKPASFDYVATTTLEAAVEAPTAANGDGKLLAGGQSLLPLLNLSGAAVRRVQSQAHPRAVIRQGRRRQGTYRRAAKWEVAACCVEDASDFGGNAGGVLCRHHRGARQAGRRTIPAGNFVDPLANCLEADEIVVEIESPILPRVGLGFEEIVCRFNDFACLLRVFDQNIVAAIQSVAALRNKEIP